MIDLIHKRHEGKGWVVFQELANATGGHVRGWADAAALGIWPSRGYELHGYEFKISREDLKKELRDPSKADNVGRYCHYWWLCVSEEKLLEGLVIPGAWGILVPKGKVLRTVRPAPKVAKPKSFDPAFCAAMIRNITKTWAPKRELNKLRDEMHQLAVKEFTVNRDESKLELERLKKRLGEFEIASGINLLDSSYAWSGKPIGRAVQIVLEHQHELDTTLERRAEALDRTAFQQEEAARATRSAAQVVRTIAREMTPQACGVVERLR